MANAEKKRKSISAARLGARLESEAKRKSRESTRRLMVYMPSELYERFQGFCDERELSMTKAAQVAIDELLNQLE